MAGKLVADIVVDLVADIVVDIVVDTVVCIEGIQLFSVVDYSTNFVLIVDCNSHCYY